MRNILYYIFTAMILLIVVDLVDLFLDGMVVIGMNWVGQYLSFIGTGHKVLPGNFTHLTILSLVLYLSNEENRKKFTRLI